MSLDNTTNDMDEQKQENIKKTKKVFYKGCLLRGYKNDKYYPPEEMLRIFEKYEILILSYGIDTVKEINKYSHHPKTWLNFVYSNLIRQQRHNLKI